MEKVKKRGNKLSLIWRNMKKTYYNTSCFKWVLST